MNAGGAWKPVAWDGLAFAIPLDWEPCRIGDGYLMFESVASPTLEVKWWPQHTDYSLDNGLKRLKKSAGITPMALPESWKAALRKALGDIRARAFSWQRDQNRGRGVILFSHRAELAAVLQLYFGSQSNPNDRPRFTQILARLGTARRDGLSRYTLYDTDVQVPADFKRTGQRFSPGRFRLVFSRGRDRITLLRLSPAETLLKRQSMADIAAAQCRVSLADLSVRDDGGGAVEWRVLVSGRIRRLVGLPERIQAGRMWHAADANRILAAWVESGQEAPELLENICSRYRAIPEGARA